MSKSRETLTFRSFIIGAILALFISIAGPYTSSFIQRSYPDLTALPLIVVFLFSLLIFLVNVPLNKLGIGLKKEELLIIFIIILVAYAIPTMGLVEQLTAHIGRGRVLRNTDKSLGGINTSAYTKMAGSTGQRSSKMLL